MNQTSNAQLAESRIIMVPISNLNPVAHGVRKTNGISVESLAASIKAEGLLQNLTVVVDSESPFAGAEEFQKYTVIAGSRRLRALKHLIAQHELPEDYQVPCRLIAETAALSASLAENAIREQMHPADEFTAFRDMVEQNYAIEDIAARFGVTPQVVERRLRLADVSPKLFELYRTTNEISLEQMMALAIVDDHKAQEKAWFKSEKFNRSPRQLRRTLTDKEISFSEDRIARLVGIKAYEAAGGITHRDLFSESGESFATDPHLVKKLAAKVLDDAAEQVRKEGWSWVEARETVTYSDLSPYTKAEPAKTTKLDDSERKQISELRAAHDKLTSEWNAMEEGELEWDQEHADSISDKIDDLEEKIKAIEQAHLFFDPKVLAKGGAIVSISETGNIKIHRGLVKGKLQQSRDDVAAAAKAKPAKAGEGHSDALVRDLTAQTGFAIAAELIANPGIAIIALAHSLALCAFYGGGAGVGHTVIKANAETQIRLAQEAGEGSADIAKIEAEHKALKSLLPRKPADLFAWLCEKGAPVSRILAYCTAVATDTVAFAEPRTVPGDYLADVLDLDMTTRWQATPAAYLSRISAAQILAALKEVGVLSAVDFARAEKMQKKELIGFAQPLLVNWLPKLMRVGKRAKSEQRDEKAANEAKPSATKKKAAK